MFESAKAIREAKRAEMLQKERRRILKVLEKHGVALPPEVVEAVFGIKMEDTG
jgi:hypothetical protein